MSLLAWHPGNSVQMSKMESFVCNHHRSLLLCESFKGSAKRDWARQVVYHAQVLCSDQYSRALPRL